MGRSRYAFHETYYPYFITSSVADGISLFADPAMANIILDALIYLQQENEVTLYAYLIIHNHIHLVAQHKQLSRKLKAFKFFTAGFVPSPVHWRYSTAINDEEGKGLIPVSLFQRRSGASGEHSVASLRNKERYFKCH